jgi:putative membrane protein
MKTRSTVVSTLLTLGASLILAAGVTAQGGPAPQDRKFVTEAAQDGMAEVRLGRMAANKATDPGVKQFGQRMVEDHSKANQELTDLARLKGIPLPKGTTPEHEVTWARLAKLNGAAFDRAYMTHMVKDHDKATGMFKKASRSLGDEELRKWAADTVPTLEDHRHMARELAGRLAGGGSARGEGQGH